jgi:hypothetical protein
MVKLCLTLWAVVALLSCSGSPSSPPALPLVTEAEWSTWRAERNDFFKHAPNSPLMDRDKAAFESLPFFAFNPALQFVVRLERWDEPKPLRLVTTEGEERPAVILGELRFRYSEAEHRLRVYQLRDQSAEHWKKPFLPFKDLTTGQETYGAGRYLDLAGGQDDWFVLDFNLAYHPACAYGRSGFQCPVTPPENKLPFRVEAGERLMPQSEAIHE